MGIEVAPALLRKREHADLIVTLVFGDLHLDCIQGWRDNNMSSQYKLEYHCGEYHNIHGLTTWDHPACALHCWWDFSKEIKALIICWCIWGEWGDSFGGGGLDHVERTCPWVEGCE